jgi:apolipoprotein D and lipocalin family protein
MLRFILIVMSLPLLAAAVESSVPLETVESLDIERYLGRWYEVARLPNRFQQACAGEVTARYSLREDGKIDVINECVKQNGATIVAQGVARVVDPTNTQLKVRFAPAFLSFLPLVWGDYWVLDLAPDYSWAVIGEPRRKYLWVLSRQPKLAEQTLQGALERAARQGYDPSTIVRTRQR